MSILLKVQRHSRKIINSSRFGFSNDVILISPDGIESQIKGIVSVIHNLIDPDTGQPVSGYLATISINRLDLNDIGVEIPEGVSSENLKTLACKIHEYR